MNTGDKLVCVKNESNRMFTVGKEYPLIKAQEYSLIEIKDDNGHARVMLSYNLSFITENNLQDPSTHHVKRAYFDRVGGAITP